MAHIVHVVIIHYSSDKNGKKYPHSPYNPLPLHRQLHRLRQYPPPDSAAAKYLYIRDNLNDTIGGIKLLKHLVHYVNFILDCLAAIYLIAAGWTCLTCLYTFVSIPCGWKGSTACHFDFFITLISACFQCSIGVLSGINTLLL